MTANQSQAATDPNKDPELTPEEMAHEIRRIDYFFITGGVLILAFFLGATMETLDSYFLSLRSGREIAEVFPSVPAKDTDTYTVPGARWVNPNWLFDFGLYLSHSKLGDVATGVLRSILCLIPVGVILYCRHAGPTLWWTSVCAALAAIGMSYRFIASSDFIATVLMAIALFLWFQAKHRKAFYWLYGCIGIAWIWSNVDVSWIFLPVMLVLLAVGEMLQSLLPASADFDASRLSPAKAVQVLIIAGLCAAVSILNPYGIEGMLFPFKWFGDIIHGPKDLLPFVRNDEMQTMLGLSRWKGLIELNLLEMMQSGKVIVSIYYWALLVMLSIASVISNFNQISLSRALMILAGIALPLWCQVYLPMSCLILSIGTALNFQEFYLGVFGRETRVGIGWTLWSQGGRLVTVLLLFLGVLMSFTGWLQGEAGRANRFGFGVAPEWYPRDAAKFLADLKPKGNMFAIRLKTAHYISYNDPNIKQFYDGRTQIFDRATLADYAALTSAITRGETSYDSKTVTDPETKKQVTIQGWKELADKHNITHFVFPFDTETLASPRILQLVMSPLRYKQLELIAVRDGFIVYGRIDKNPDQDQFKTMAIDNNTKYLKSEMEPTVVHGFPSGPDFFEWVWKRNEKVRDGYLPSLFYQHVSRLGSNRPGLYPGSMYASINQARESLLQNSNHAPSYSNMAWSYLQLLDYEFSHVLATEKKVAEARQKELKEQAEKEKANPAGKAEGAPKADAPKAEPAKADAPKSEPAKPADASKKPGVSWRRFHLPTLFAAILLAPQEVPAKSNPPTQAAPAKAAPTQATPDEKMTPSKQIAGSPTSPQRQPAATPGQPTQPGQANQPTELQAMMADYIDPAFRLTKSKNPFRHWQAINAAHSAIVANPNDPANHEMYAKLCLGNQMMDLGAFHFRRAVELTSPSLIASANLKPVVDQLQAQVDARSEAYQQRLGQLMREREKAGMEPDDPFARFGIAMQLSMPQLAIKELEDARVPPELEPQRAYQLFLAYLDVGQGRKAQEILELESIKQYPNLQVGEFEFFYATIYLLQGDSTNANKILEQAIAMIRATRAKSAIDSVDNVLRYGNIEPIPEDSFIKFHDSIFRESHYLFYLGIIKIELGKPKEAVELFEKALELMPNYPFRAVISNYVELIAGKKIDPTAPKIDYEKLNVAKRFETPKPTAPNEGVKPNKADPSKGTNPGAANPAKANEPAPAEKKSAEAKPAEKKETVKAEPKKN